MHSVLYRAKMQVKEICQSNISEMPLSGWGEASRAA